MGLHISTGWQRVGAYIYDERQFPPKLRMQLESAREVTRISLDGEQSPTLAVRKPVLTGIVGQVYIGFPLGCAFESSIRSMERVVLASIVIVMLIGSRSSLRWSRKASSGRSAG